MELNPILFRDFTYIFVAAVLGGLVLWRLRLPLILGLTYVGRGQVTKKATEDAVPLSKDKCCSVSAVLSKIAAITYTIEQVS